MTDQFKTWLVMSALMLTIITILCLILKIKESIQLIRYKKEYFKAIEDKTFFEKFPNMSGIWEIDKKMFFEVKAKSKKLEYLIKQKLIKGNLPEVKDEITDELS